MCKSRYNIVEEWYSTAMVLKKSNWDSFVDVFTNDIWAHLLQKYWKKSLCCNFYSCDPIKSQIRPWHDSWDGVAWTKLWLDWIIIFHANSTSILHVVHVKPILLSDFPWDGPYFPMPAGYDWLKMPTLRLGCGEQWQWYVWNASPVPQHPAGTGRIGTNSHS